MSRIAVSLLAALALCGCGGEAPKEVPKAAKLEHAPDVYRVKFETTKGDFIVEVTRAWAPRGADRFYELVTSRYYDGVRFHRVLKKFIAQFGINGDANNSSHSPKTAGALCHRRAISLSESAAPIAR